ncbi:MAG TPA: T9SS type A sorting domain-containing protein [Ignavibacteria bacterium]
MKNFLIFLVIFAAMAANAVSQDKPNPPVPTYYSLNPKGDISNPMFSTTPPSVPEMSEAEKNLEQQLEAARSSNNTMAATQIQAQLDQLRGHTPVYPPCDPRMHFEIVNQPPSEGDYQVSQVHNRDVWSNAVATVPVGNPNAGNVWVVTTDWGPGGADTVKFYRSTNNGVSWSYWGALWLAFNHDFRADELDVEIVYDGVNVWMFGVGGLTDLSDGNRKKVMFFRVNLGGGPAYASILNFPGNVAGNNFYNPRIVSDASNFTSNAYVMVLCSMDSLHNTNNHFLKQKYMISTSPFGGSPSIDYTQPSGAAGFYWYCSACTTGNYYLYGDIGYYRDDGGTGANRVFAVYSNPTAGYNQLWIAWLNNYFTYGGNITIAEPNYNFGARIAFNGGANNRFGMISIVRQFSGTDWDPYYYRTTNGGTTLGGWTNDYIDISGDRARRCDITAIRNGSNLFKACYVQDNPTAPSAFYTSWGGASWSTPRVISNLLVDSMYSTNRAGYINGGGDDCLGIWGTSPTGTYASRLCNTTVGIQQTGIPAEYSLSQNYPNPFNPGTSISFGLPKAAFVKLTVYNILGEVVATLVNEQKQAGTYDINFNASNFASGVYLYKLETDNFVDVKKMLLIK